MMTLKELRAKRKSVAGIEQITKALKVVSQNKLLKTQHQWYKGRKEFISTLKRLEQLQYVQHIQDPPPPSPSVPASIRVLIILASDRGFCGAFNSKLQKTSAHILSSTLELERVVIIGKKLAAWGQQMAVRHLHLTWECIPNIHEFTQKNVKDWLEKLYPELPLSDDAQQVSIVYTHYINAITQEVVVLPMGRFESKDLQATLESLDPKYTPPLVHQESIGSVFENTLPLMRPDLSAVITAWKKMCFFQQFLSILYEHAVSEHSARMRAMEKAGDNASELLLALQKQYNNLRQTNITKELVEITAGVQSTEN
jgi:F-type H+-transporting ATPase subunit gamma